MRALHSSCSSPKLLVVLVTASLFLAAGVARAQDAGDKAAPKPPSRERAARKPAAKDSLLERDTLTNKWFGLGERLEDKGISINLTLTEIFQANVKGGISTSNPNGRNSGSYDLEIEADTEKLFRLAGGTFYVCAEGSWNDKEGINDHAVGSLVNVNADAAGEHAIEVTALWYEQAFLNERLRIRIGKQDITGGFDCHGCPVAFDHNSYADDQTTQFLNNGLLGNPTVPFPDNGLGIVVYARPVDRFYVCAGVADAQADKGETGFNTTFNGKDYFFYALELGVTPLIPSPSGDLLGAYRIGAWLDTTRK